MGMITVRNVDDSVKRALRERAARHGRSMEAEVRSILVDAVSRQDAPNLYESIRTHFEGSDWDPAIADVRDAAPQRDVTFGR